jgi:transposase
MQISTIGIDLAKNVFQLHGVDAQGKVTLVRQLRRNQMIAFLAKLPACLIGMEACATSHHWAREISKLGHEVKLIPPAYVKAYVKRQKNDAADAAACRKLAEAKRSRWVKGERVQAEQIASALPPASVVARSGYRIDENQLEEQGPGLKTLRSAESRVW